MNPTSRNLIGAFRRRPRLTLLTLSSIVALAAIAAVFPWAQYHLRAAHLALDRYAFAEAQHHLELCMTVRRSASLHLLTAQTARRRDDYATAEEQLAACLEMAGMTEAVARERVLLTAQQGDLAGVESSLRARADADDAEAALTLEALAKGYVNCFWQENALECLNRLLRRAPQHPQALLMRARLWEDRVRKGDKERDEDALRDYQAAVELGAGFEARLGLARTLYRMGHPWESMLQYEGLRSSSADPEVLFGLARCRYTLHEVDEARQLLDEILERQPTHAAALLERGRLARHAGEVDEAEKWLRRAVDAAPGYDCEAQRLLCMLLEEANQTEDARRCRAQLSEREAHVLRVERLTLQANREPHNVALRYDIARELMRLGREQDAVAALFFVLEQEPRHRPSHEALADYFERTGQHARAARHRRAGSLGTPAQ